MAARKTMLLCFFFFFLLFLKQPVPCDCVLLTFGGGILSRLRLQAHGWYAAPSSALVILRSQTTATVIWQVNIQQTV